MLQRTWTRTSEKPSQKLFPFPGHLLIFLNVSLIQGQHAQVFRTLFSSSAVQGAKCHSPSREDVQEHWSMSRRAAISWGPQQQSELYRVFFGTCPSLLGTSCTSTQKHLPSRCQWPHFQGKCGNLWGTAVGQVGLEELMLQQITCNRSQQQSGTGFVGRITDPSTDRHVSTSYLPIMMYLKM